LTPLKDIQTRQKLNLIRIYGHPLFSGFAAIGSLKSLSRVLETSQERIALSLAERI
jgi:hypothetical protein